MICTPAKRSPAKRTQQCLATQCAAALRADRHEGTSAFKHHGLHAVARPPKFMAQCRAQAGWSHQSDRGSGCCPQTSMSAAWWRTRPSQWSLPPPLVTGQHWRRRIVPGNVSNPEFHHNVGRMCSQRRAGTGGEGGLAAAPGPAALEQRFKLAPLLCVGDPKMMAWWTPLVVTCCSSLPATPSAVFRARRPQS